MKNAIVRHHPDLIYTDEDKFSESFLGRSGELSLAAVHEGRRQLSAERMFLDYRKLYTDISDNDISRY